MGKATEAVLKRSVLGQLHADRNAGRELYGADAAGATATVPVYTAVGAVPGFEDKPEALITASANNLAAAGAIPQAVSVLAMLPPETEEAVLKADMRRIAEAARAHEMQVICGHTQVSDAVNRPLYQVTGIGQAMRAAGETAEAARAAGQSTAAYAQPKLLPGQTLVLTKWIALAGTAALAEHYEAELRRRFPQLLLDRAKEFAKLMSVVLEARAATHFGACAMHDLSQGGIFGALWEMAERAGVGLEVDLKKIPVRQETIEICEYFDMNPYCLYSAGALLIGTAQPEALMGALGEQGIPTAVIGRATRGNDRILRNGAEVRFLDRPPQDEWYRKHID